MFLNYVTDKGFIFRIYNYLKKFSLKKMGKGHEQKFFKDKLPMTHSHMEKRSAQDG